MSLQRYIRQLRPIQENKKDYVDRVQSIFEASSGIKFDDLWKRDNLQRFIDKATSGELIDSSNNKIPSIDSNNELIKVIKTFDAPPEGEDLTKFIKLFKDNIGSFSKIPKAENGFSTTKSGTPSGAQWEALIAIGVNKIKNREWTVSYTHLTLPTNREV